MGLFFFLFFFLSRFHEKRGYRAEKKVFELDQGETSVFASAEELEKKFKQFPFFPLVGCNV